MATAIIRFTIDGWDEIDTDPLSAFASTIRMRKQLSGDLTGESIGLFINAGQQEGSRSYMVCERFTGTAKDGTESSLVVEHGALEDDDSATFGRIVPGSGTGIFTNARGTIAFDGDDEGEFMRLDYRTRG